MAVVAVIQTLIGFFHSSCVSMLLYSNSGAWTFRRWRSDLVNKWVVIDSSIRFAVPVDIEFGVAVLKRFVF